MKRIRDQISTFLYKQAGYIDFMKRLTGLWLIGIMPLELLNGFGIGAAGPYHVPSWRLGHNFICFPEPPFMVSVIVWALDFLACIAMIAGVRSRLIPLFLFLVWFYYQSLEWQIFHSSFVILMSLYLLAFTVHRQPRSLSRLLIQIALSSCYVFSALHKFIHPEFITGLTMYELLGRGYLLRPELLPVIQWLNLPRWFTDLSTYATVFGEMFIGLGLWFKQTRMLAVYAGIFLHSIFTLAFPGIELFACVAWTGYLAFFENKFEAKAAAYPSLSFEKPLLDKLVAGLVCGLCIAIPARLFFLSHYTYLNMSLYDRAPWGFSMFLFHEQVRYVEVDIRISDQTWHKIPLTGRMSRTSSANDLLALAYYVAKQHPEADRIVVGTILLVNSHGQRIRKYVYHPAEHKFDINESVLDGIQIHR